ncbi:hypothetical protein Misp06_04367 [Microbulbifer sp. NBRC 101763]|uniref:hypothetical protein n=1 Tax=Microbulbifer sp. NBRC 101763 TaxID=1113820 RepID=UPI0030A3C154
MTQRITIRDAVQSKLQTLSGYTFPFLGITEDIDSKRLSAIVLGFTTEKSGHDIHGGNNRQLNLFISKLFFMVLLYPGFIK